MAAPPRSGSTVGALRHGLAVLDLYSPEERVLGVGEMARRLGLHKSSASRLAATLSAAGYLQPAGAPGRYQLGAKLVRLADLAASTADVRQLALPRLRELVSMVGDTGHLGTLDGAEAVTIAVVDGWQTVRMHSTVGRRSPAHCSAMGKVLLAELSDRDIRARFGRRALEPRTPNTKRSLKELLACLHEVRDAGFAFDDEELELGLRCVAAPILDHSGRRIAAVGISGPNARITRDNVRQLAREVQQAAADISSAMGAPPPADLASAR